MKIILALFVIIGSAFAACPNGCSGNGVCGANDKCSCYQNWQGADCSLRTCNYALAWADTADGTNSAHYYAECSNKGICDRKTGECKCFDGYEGKGCRRSTCPEKCSGHGTCEYIDELAGDYYDRRAGPGSRYKATSGTRQGTGYGHVWDNAGAAVTDGSGCPTGGLYCTTSAQAVSNTVTRTANTEQYHGFLYQLWDAQKIQGCKCDLGYSGPDCSSRVAPKGDDPLTTVKVNMMKQMVRVGQATLANSATAYTTEEFYMVYFDPYGGVWRTQAIAATTSDTTAASRVQSALLNLPNEVLEGVKVKAATGTVSYCERGTDGQQHYPSAGGHGTANSCSSTTSVTHSSSDHLMDFVVEFADKPGQTGVQYLFDVDIAATANGAFPKSNGLGGSTYANSATSTATVWEYISDADLGNVSELAECSDRGLDNGDGECECFDGFRGLACEEQEALV